MNWDAIGALGEIVGAIAVFVSLLYLAVQIRQSTELARTQYHTNSVTILEPFTNWKSANPRVFREGMTDFGSLNSDDRINLDSVLTLFVLTFKDVLEARERGFMDNETYLAWEGYIGTHLAMPGGRMWWNEAREIYIEKVQAAIDNSIARTPPYDELMSIVFRGASRKNVGDGR
jgi:hypothetical protein